MRSIRFRKLDVFPLCCAVVLLASFLVQGCSMFGLGKSDARPDQVPALFSTDPNVTNSMRFSSADDLFGRTLDILTTWRQANLINDPTQAKIDKYREDGYRLILTLRHMQDVKRTETSDFGTTLDQFKMILLALQEIQEQNNPHPTTQPVQATESIALALGVAVVSTLADLLKWTVNRVEQRRAQGQDLQPEDIDFIRQSTDLAVMRNRAVGVTPLDQHAPPLLPPPVDSAVVNNDE